MLASQTQLVDPNPQVDCPLRVDAPAALNAPVRARSVSRDERIQLNSFTPAALRRKDGDMREAEANVSSGISHTATTRTAVSS